MFNTMTIQQLQFPYSYSICLYYNKCVSKHIVHCKIVVKYFMRLGLQFLQSSKHLEFSHLNFFVHPSLGDLDIGTPKELFRHCGASKAMFTIWAHRRVITWKIYTWKSFKNAQLCVCFPQINMMYIMWLWRGHYHLYYSLGRKRILMITFEALYYLHKIDICLYRCERRYITKIFCTKQDLLYLISFSSFCRVTWEHILRHRSGAQCSPIVSVCGALSENSVIWVLFH